MGKWGSGRQKTWHEKEGSKMKISYEGGVENRVKQTGGVVCSLCCSTIIQSVGAAVAGVGACAYGAKKGYDYYKQCKTKKKSKSKKKNNTKKKSKSSKKI